MIALSIFAAATMIGLDNWFKFKERTADLTPWKSISVESDNRFMVVRHDEIKTIDLCGVVSIGEQTKQYLASVIRLGDGTVKLESVDNSYEAWVSLKAGYEVELVSHISTILPLSPARLFLALFLSNHLQISSIDKDEDFYGYITIEIIYNYIKAEKDIGYWILLTGI